MYSPRTFACPSCKEIINESMKECRFCGAPVDPAIAQASAEVQEKVNRACSDASYLRTASIVMFVFLGLSFIPLLPTYWGFIITFFITLVLLVRWQVRFGSLQTNDPDFGRARRLRTIAFVLWLVAIPAGFVARPLLMALISNFFES